MPGALDGIWAPLITALATVTVAFVAARYQARNADRSVDATRDAELHARYEKYVASILSDREVAYVRAREWEAKCDEANRRADRWVRRARALEEGWSMSRRRALDWMEHAWDMLSPGERNKVGPIPDEVAEPVPSPESLDLAPPAQKP